MNRSALAAVAVMCAIAATPGCDTSTATENDRSSSLNPAFLGERQEARAFLDSGDAVVWSEHATVEQVDALVADMYAAGVTKAEFAGIEALEGSRISAWLLFEMPPGAARAECFTVFNRFREKHVGDHVADQGQPFVDVELD